MAEQTLADLIEAGKNEIARWTAQDIKSRQIGAYDNYSVEQLTGFFFPTIEMLIRYLRTSDVTEWRDYIAKTAEYRRSQGLSMDSVVQAAVVINMQIRKLLERELPGPQNAAIRDKHMMRLDGSTSLAKAIILKANMQKKN